MVAARRLPEPVRRYTDWALAGLAVGTVLGLFAFLTNPVPDPSFPWASLPAQYRLPVRQPRIEHWPVSYSVGVWLWVAGFPALFLKGYQRYVGRWGLGPTAWLAGLPAGAMVAWTTYCRWFWPKLHPATWNAPSYTLVCWLYCSSYDPLWSNLAFAVAGVGLAAAALAVWSRRATPLLAAFGVLAFPLGMPALVEVHRRRAVR